LRPVTFHWDMDKIDALSGVDASDPATLEGRELKARQSQTGFLAQEVEAAAKASDYDFSGVVKPSNEHEHYRMSYETFVVPLVKAIQEQQAQIEPLRAHGDELKALRADVQALRVELSELKAAKSRVIEPQRASLFNLSWLQLLAAFAMFSVFGWARRWKLAPRGDA